MCLSMLQFMQPFHKIAIGDSMNRLSQIALEATTELRWDQDERTAKNVQVLRMLLGFWKPK